jgi:predicted transglutaminase-like protease
MNIKQTISVTYYYFSCYILGHCPTSGEIRNSKMKDLASRLKAGSCKETLTNILEWQERNIEFWAERHPIQVMLSFAVVISGVISFIGALGFVFLLFGNIQPLPLLVYFIVIWFVSFVSCVITTIAIMIAILHFNRKFPWREILGGLKNIFWPSISLDFLLENKLGVCRDYAKLTACLLLNIYPNAEIYFASAPNHVATGMNVENRLYMLDQRLPILTIERWNDYRKPGKFDRTERFDPIEKTLNKADKKTFLKAKNASKLDTEKLAKKMMELLNIKEQTDEEAVLLRVPILWKKGVIKYEDDEMVNYSLARYLKMRISSELMRINQIVGIELERQKDDLMFLIRFNSRK